MNLVIYGIVAFFLGLVSVVSCSVGFMLGFRNGLSVGYEDGYYDAQSRERD